MDFVKKKIFQHKLKNGPVQMHPEIVKDESGLALFAE